MASLYTKISVFCCWRALKSRETRTSQLEAFPPTTVFCGLFPIRRIPLQPPAGDDRPVRASEDPTPLSIVPFFRDSLPHSLPTFASTSSKGQFSCKPTSGLKNLPEGRRGLGAATFPLVRFLLSAAQASFAVSEVGGRGRPLAPRGGILGRLNAVRLGGKGRRGEDPTAPQHCQKTQGGGSGASIGFVWMKPRKGGKQLSGWSPPSGGNRTGV